MQKFLHFICITCKNIFPQSATAFLIEYENLQDASFPHIVKWKHDWNSLQGPVQKCKKKVAPTSKGLPKILETQFSQQDMTNRISQVKSHDHKFLYLFHPFTSNGAHQSQNWRIEKTQVCTFWIATLRLIFNHDVDLAIRVVRLALHLKEEMRRVFALGIIVLPEPRPFALVILVGRGTCHGIITVITTLVPRLSRVHRRLRFRGWIYRDLEDLAHRLVLHFLPARLSQSAQPTAFFRFLAGHCRTIEATAADGWCHWIRTRSRITPDWSGCATWKPAKAKE